MKKYFLLIFACMASVIILSSCSNDDSPSNPASGPFVAKVDGAQFTSDAAEAKAKYATSTKMLQMVGRVNGSNETIVLSLMPFSADFTFWQPGTYDFNPGNITTSNYMACLLYTSPSPRD